MEERDIELAIRKAISSEIAQHREFLQEHFKLLTWGVGVIFAAGAIVFTYFFGKNLEETESQIIREVNAKVIEYRIVEDLKTRLNELIQISVVTAVNTPSTKAQINQLVEEAVSSHVAKVSDQIDQRLAATIKEEVQKASTFDSEELIKRVQLPRGAILPFNLASCPQGWLRFDLGNGRFLVGAGNNLGLTTRVMLEVGGSESHVLSIDEIPMHKHETVEAGDSTNSEWGISGPRNGRHGVRWERFATSYTSPVGGNKPHNNMPPYVAVLFCEKQ